MSYLAIPVRIIASDAHCLHLEALESMEDCPQCARGEGCGARPWFGGYFRARALIVPRLPGSVWQNGDRGELRLAAGTLNRLAALTYGLPLLTFLTLLALLQQHSEIVQLLFAGSGGGISAYFARRYGQARLLARLSLHPLTGCPPTYHPPHG